MFIYNFDRYNTILYKEEMEVFLLFSFGVLLLFLFLVSILFFLLIIDNLIRNKRPLKRYNWLIIILVFIIPPILLLSFGRAKTIDTTDKYELQERSDNYLDKYPEFRE